VLSLVLTLVYAVVATSFWRMTDCVRVSAMGGTREALRSDARVECRQGDHRAVYGLAWVCLVVFLAGWPLCTLAYLVWNHVRGTDTMPKRFATRRSHMAFFCDGDFRWNRYYFRHVTLLVEFVLGYVVSRALVHPVRALVISEVVLGVYLLALVTVRPYAPTKLWKFPVHVCVVVVAMLMAALNHVLLVSSAARGLEWLVFVLVTALLLVLLVMGCAHLLVSVDSRATDTKLASGARAGFGAFPGDAPQVHVTLDGPPQGVGTVEVELAKTRAEPLTVSSLPAPQPAFPLDGARSGFSQERIRGADP
jgi:hypothetical protein